jgi:exodeoxyribonuclease VIII
MVTKNTMKVRSTLLKAWIKSPQHAWQYLYGKQSGSTAMALGTLIHTALLEPKELTKRYVVKDYDARTKEGKAREEEIKTAGLIPVTQSDWDVVQTTKRNAFANPTIAALLNARGANKEFQIETDTLTGTIDYYDKKTGTLLDVKTASNAEPHAFARSFNSYLYHVQLALYRRLLVDNGMPVNRAWCLVVETTSPWNVDLYMVPDEWLAIGDTLIDAQLPDLLYAIEKESWRTGYQMMPSSLDTYFKTEWIKQNSDY